VYNNKGKVRQPQAKNLRKVRTPQSKVLDNVQRG
jgi:hypothetical protein